MSIACNGKSVKESNPSVSFRSRSLYCRVVAVAITVDLPDTTKKKTCRAARSYWHRPFMCGVRHETTCVQSTVSCGVISRCAAGQRVSVVVSHQQDHKSTREHEINALLCPHLAH